MPASDDTTCPLDTIAFKDDLRPEIDAIVQLYKKSGLLRPIEDLPRLRRMYENSPLVLTAWDDDHLAGILRGWSDGGFLGYIADLAVDPAYQRRGIGKRLLDLAVASNSEVQFVLRAADTAALYYSHLCWKHVENGWYWPRIS
ncbi:MAG: GNAT family N-acetyltransferase [Chloroflexota bacterium]